MATTILFPSNPLKPKAVDDSFGYEAAAAKEVGYKIGRIDLEIILGGEAKIDGLSPTGPVVYRGWLNKPEAYEKMFKASEERLVVKPQDYLDAYHLPRWYKLLGSTGLPPSHLTPESIWVSPEFDLTNLDGLFTLVSTVFGRDEATRKIQSDWDAWVKKEQEEHGPNATFGVQPPIALLELPGTHAVIVKDYVKSAKHRWYDACFIHHADAEAEVKRVVKNFLDTVSDGLVGSLVFRKWVRFKRIGIHSKTNLPLINEWRAFMSYGKVFYIAPYWAEGDYTGARPEEHIIAGLADGLHELPFIAVDVAQRDDDDRWMIIEVNPGGEAGVPEGGDVKEFYRALATVFPPIAKCMRDYCSELRWMNYDGKGGESVLCKEHTEEVLRGEAKAPPLRRNIDYQSVGRKTFLVTELPDDLKPKS